MGEATWGSDILGWLDSAFLLYPAEARNMVGNSYRRSPIVLASFFRKTKEGEEGERAKREDPSAQLERDGESWVTPPDKGGERQDAGKVEMCVRPSFPGFERAGDSIRVDLVDTEGCAEKEFGEGNGHEPEVPAARH